MREDGRCRMSAQNMHILIYRLTYVTATGGADLKKPLLATGGDGEYNTG